MAAPIKFEFKLQNRAALSDGLRRLSVATGKLPAEVINRAVMSIAIRAKGRMPVVTAARIREELQEYKVPVSSYSRKGKLLGKGKARSKSFFYSPTGVPLLALIIQARSNPKYKGPWKREASPWKGVSREVGASRMLDAMRRIYNARIRSGGFFRVCAAAVMFVFRNTRRNLPGVTSGGSISSRIGKIAGGTPATGTGRAIARFWVAATQPDTQRNKEALKRVAEPVWQEALNHERDFVLRKAAEAEYKNTMRGMGFRVT